jgi:hypothetical protein
VIIESVLIDTCSFFDSLCQTLIREKSKSGHVFKQESQIPDFTKKVSGDEQFNFADYRILLEGDFVLPGKKVNLNTYEDDLYTSPLLSHPDSISGYMIEPFKEWATGVPNISWKAYTSLKHDRISNFREAKLRNVLHSLAAVYIVLAIRNETEFKIGAVSPELYDLFFPKYWAFHGRVALMNFMWS